MLKVNQLVSGYGTVQILNGANMKVDKQSVVALLGGNGTGKSSILKAASGLIRSWRGTIEFNNEQIQNLPPHEIVARGLVQVTQGKDVFPAMSVTENLRLGGFTANDSIDENIERVFTLFPILKDRDKNTAGYLSGGEQQMLAIGRALMSNPKYLLLDEPSLGLAPKLVQQISELILEINSQGVTVLLVEQNANMALKISSHGYIMETGNIVMDNPSSKLLQDQDVQEFYLGLNAEGTERKSFKDVKHYKRKKRWLSWKMQLNL